MGVPPSNRYGTGPTHAHCLHEPPVFFAVCCNLTTKFPQERIEQSHLLFIINILHSTLIISATSVPQYGYGLFFPRIFLFPFSILPVPATSLLRTVRTIYQHTINNPTRGYRQKTALLSTKNEYGNNPLPLSASVRKEPRPDPILI